ncbi:MAG: hypothetical protein R3C27_09605 [Hyphomonadaceae bacterium]
MRFAAASLAVLALAACNQQPETPPAAEEEQVFMRVPPPWFICDSVNSGAVIVFDRNPSGDVRVAEYQKSDGSIVQRIGYFVGDEEPGAGSLHTELVRDQGSDGWVHMTNSGMLETPASAYTPRFVSVELDGRDVRCRWLPRTRVIGFTSRRSFVVHEDANGALTYSAFNFGDAGSSRTRNGAENAQTSASSLEIVGGVTGQTQEATTYTFETQGFRYVLSLNRDGTGALDVTRDGAPLSNEPLIGYQQGTPPPAPTAATP